MKETNYPTREDDPTYFWGSLLLRLVILVCLITLPAQIRNAWSADSGPQVSAAPVEVAALPRLNLDIWVVCQSKAVIFQIKNRAGDWPERARIEVLSENKGKAVISRPMLLKKGQRASFRLKTGGEPTGLISLAISGKWIPQEYERHVGASCR